jgi:prepilin-type processing-associated H-X9-DG protein
MSSPRHPAVIPAGRAEAALTLIELLIVIAVIAVLVSLLLSVVGVVRQKADSASCVSQLRQLAMAHAGYRYDHNGQSPPVASNPPTDPLSEGHHEYGFCYLRYYYRPGPRYIWTTSNIWIPEPFEHCPSVQMNKLSLNTSASSTTPDYAIRVESADGNIINYNNNFLYPSQTPLIWDGWLPNWGGGSTQTYTTVPLRHSGGINCAFLDGHVEFISQTDKRLYSGWWNVASEQPKASDSLLGTGNPLGIKTLPQ